MKQPDLWKFHNQAMREHCEYLFDGLMDCYREEMSYYMPYSERLDTDNVQVKPTFVYFKNDVRALELNKRVTELENAIKHLLEKEKGETPNASKQKYEPF